MYIDAAQNTAGEQVAILQEKRVALQGVLSGLQNATSAKVQRLWCWLIAPTLLSTASCHLMRLKRRPRRTRI